MTSYEELQKQGFTQKGIERLQKTIMDYENKLVEQSCSIAQSNKDDSGTYEVTNEHVRIAARILQDHFGKKEKSIGEIIASIFEYICSFAGGIGASNISKSWGVLILVLSAVVGVILVCKRMISENKGE